MTHSESAREIKGPGTPGIIHTIMLLAKRRLFKNWLDPKTPDISTLITQLKTHLLLDKTYTERHKEKGT